jgi:hypothetical protein
MKIFVAKKLKSDDLPKLIKFAGKECVNVAFNDGCYTAIIPAFIRQLNNVLPEGKQCIRFQGSTDWGSGFVTDYVERRIKEMDPTKTGAIVVDHWRQWIKREDTISTLSLKYYFDQLAASIQIPLIVIYRYTL